MRLLLLLRESLLLANAPRSDRNTPIIDERAAPYTDLALRGYRETNDNDAPSPPSLSRVGFLFEPAEGFSLGEVRMFN
jgi:hypothetical protein